MAQIVCLLFSVPLVVDTLILKHKLLNCTLHLSSPVGKERAVRDADWEFMGMGKGRASLAVVRKDYLY